MGKKKNKGWLPGLTWTLSELESTSRGGSSEAFEYTYQRAYPTSLQIKGAKKELRKRYRKKGYTPKSYNRYDYGDEW